MSEDLKIIKKKYGEKMMHLCRYLFPSILEKEGLLSDLMLKSFEPSKCLYQDIKDHNMEYDFKDYIYSLIDIQREEVLISDKTPKELLAEAGYNLYYCQTEEEIQKFKKYYASGEELCTFKDNRLEQCYVFFAVKKNIDDIKRKDFHKPQRQDEYGTSVLCIQFTRGTINTISIKNRYNHTVNNSDATFSNNLENIVPGLTKSFEREYHLNLKNGCYDFELDYYVCASDGKYYKYNYEVNNIYYCPNNIIIDNFNVIKTYQDRGKYILMDYFILDLEAKTITLYDKREHDSFIDAFVNITNISVTKTNLSKLIKITCQEGNAYIELDEANRIIWYSNHFITTVGNNFLLNSENLLYLDLPNVMKIGNEFLGNNSQLKYLNLKNVKEIENGFLWMNEELENLILSNLLKVGDNFLFFNIKLKNLNLEKLEIIGNGFLYFNRSLTSIDLPNARYIKNSFLATNNQITIISFPNVLTIGNYFLHHNRQVMKINLPSVRYIGDNFMYDDDRVIFIYLPNLISHGLNFPIFNNKSYKRIKN